MEGLDNLQLTKLCKVYNLPLQNIYLRDEVPKQIPPSGKKFYIFNLDSSHGNGTHWTGAFCFGDKNIAYFDSFGFPPPLKIANFLKSNKHKVSWNNYAFQSINSDVCGFWVVLFGRCMNTINGENPHDGFNNFLSTFNSNFVQNDQKLLLLFK